MPVVIIILINALATCTALAEVDASINKHRFSFEEAIELSIRSSSSMVPKINTTPLEDDFIVSNVDRQTRLRNDITPIHYENEWTITLYPKFPGNLRLPPVVVNKEETRAIPIQVVPLSNPPHRPLHRVEVTVDSGSAVVGQPYLMTVKLLTRHPNAAVDLRWAQKPDLTPISVSKPVTFPTQINNVLYTQTSLRLAWIIPNTNNTLDRLHHLVLKTTLTLPGERELPIEAKSNTFKLELFPSPIAADGQPLLMAQALELHTNLKTTEALTIGKPTKHSVSITSTNSDPATLPKYTFLTKPPLIYSNHDDTLQISNNNGQLQTRRIVSAQLTPQEGVEVVKIPGWTIKWWNTETKQWQQSTLADQTIRLVQAKNSNNNDKDSTQFWSGLSLLLTLILGIAYGIYRNRQP